MSIRVDSILPEIIIVSWVTLKTISIATLSFNRTAFDISNYTEILIAASVSLSDPKSMEQTSIVYFNIEPALTNEDALPN